MKGLFYGCLLVVLAIAVLSLSLIMTTKVARGVCVLVAILIDYGAMAAMQYYDFKDNNKEK